MRWGVHQQFLNTLLIAHLAVAAAEKQQRFSFVRSFSLRDLAQVNRVIAGVDRRGHLALQIRERAVEYRSAVRADPVTDALELLAAADCEPARQRFLFRGQDIDGEDLALVEARIALGLLVDADQRERRNERY